MIERKSNECSSKFPAFGLELSVHTAIIFRASHTFCVTLMQSATELHHPLSFQILANRSVSNPTVSASQSFDFDSNNESLETLCKFSLQREVHKLTEILSPSSGVLNCNASYFAKH